MAIPKSSGLSNAQTYFIADKASDAVKIGRSTAETHKRLATAQSYNPHVLELIATIDADVEFAIHKMCGDAHIHSEWFRLSAPVIQQALQSGQIDIPAAFIYGADETKTFIVTPRWRVASSVNTLPMADDYRFF